MIPDLDKNDIRFYFIECAAVAVGWLWMQLAFATGQYLIGFLGLAILYRRFRREKEVG